MKKEQQIFIAVGIGLVVAIIVYFQVLLSPINNSIAEKQKKIDELAATVDNAKREAGQLDYLKQKVVVLESQVKELQERLPKEKDFPDLLRRFTKMSQKCGMKIRNIQPLPLNTATSGEYNELPYTIQFAGSFHTLGNFLSDIGQEKRLLSSRELKISQSITADKMNTISGSFILIAFMSKN